MTAAGLTLLTAPPALAAPVEPLGHAGRWTTDASGRVVVLHGVAVVVGGAFGDPMLGEQTAEQLGFGVADADLLAANGFNVVRLGMFYRGFEPLPGSYDDAYLESIARTQRVLADAGIFTVLDFHQDQLAPEYNGRGFPSWALQDAGLPNNRAGFPGGYFVNPALNRAYDSFWSNAPAPDMLGLSDHFAAAWRHVAARFAAEPMFAGYDIFNEPWPGSAYPPCANPAGCPPGGFDQTTLTDFSNSVIDAIRGADGRHLVYYEPNLMFDVGAKTGHGRVDDPNVGMSFHNYCLGAAPGLPHAPDPIGLCESVGERLVFQNAEEHSAATGATLLMTEFGDTEDASVHARMVAQADAFMVGWTEWAYMGSTGEIKIDYTKPPTPDNLRIDTLRAIVRPYPRIVAGTPRRWGFDPATQRFDAVWSTRLPDGRPAGRRQSEVFVPRLRYGGEYRVQLAGAELLPGGDSQLLRIRACADAARVQVTVTDQAPAPTRDCVDEEPGRRGPCSRPLLGSGRRDRLLGTPGGDRILGLGGGDRILGFGGRDCLFGGPGADVLRGGDGRDRLHGGIGRDLVRSVGHGRDLVRCGSGADSAIVGFFDRVRGCERVRRR